MKQFYTIIFVLLLVSCGQEKSVLLPEIENAKITEILDVSPAYLFYDDTQPDSLELNRKNLIGTTNWLFNVDKRLTLKQAIPKIKFLQEKKRNAQMHKNENAKNYYTCNDTSIKNLGFIEFTDIHYWDEKATDFYKKSSDLTFVGRHRIYIDFIDENQISVNIMELPIDNESMDLKSIVKNTNFSFKEYTTIEFSNFLKSFKKTPTIVHCSFNKKLTFQNYISFKSLIEKFEIEGVEIDNNEFIY
ncbi:hypothetical protein [Psychroserpens ponticola]|uniref:Lipoprotein n=1 Tax=Psychroserpens ponticola TaxID=2932268 RepID=A0ABY7RZ68_9FLAO|nr:hypothetical protein [Psychroserpens ponticola]WCO02444.1 hypothetical protein MUN68_002875 [Psychroserpens ponticola]